MSAMNSYPAEPVRAPAPTAAEQAAAAQHEEYIAKREAMESRSMVRGLLLLALVVLVLSVWRAGVGHVFAHGWWRL